MVQLEAVNATARGTGELRTKRADEVVCTVWTRGMSDQDVYHAQQSDCSLLGREAKRKKLKARLLVPNWRGARFLYIENHYAHGLLQAPRRLHLRGMPHGTPSAGRSCLLWALRPVLSQNPPDEVGKRHTMRLAICQRVLSTFSPPLAVARGGEMPSTASYTTQSSALGVPSHQVDVRAWQYRHPGLALYRGCTLYQI
jgi:hypothetical protein